MSKMLTSNYDAFFSQVSKIFLHDGEVNAALIDKNYIEQLTIS